MSNSPTEPINHFQEDKTIRYYYLIKDIIQSFDREDNKGVYSSFEDSYDYKFSNINIESSIMKYDTKTVIKGLDFTIEIDNHKITCDNFSSLEEEVFKLIDITNSIVTSFDFSYYDLKDFRLSFTAMTDGDFKLNNDDLFFIEHYEEYSRDKTYKKSDILDGVKSTFNEIIKRIPEKSKWVKDFFLVYENLSLVELLNPCGLSIIGGNQDVSFEILLVDNEENKKQHKRTRLQNTVNLIQNLKLDEKYMFNLVEKSLNGDVNSLNELIIEIQS